MIRDIIQIDAPAVAGGGAAFVNGDQATADATSAGVVTGITWSGTAPRVSATFDDTPQSRVPNNAARKEWDLTVPTEGLWAPIIQATIVTLNEQAHLSLGFVSASGASTWLKGFLIKDDGSGDIKRRILTDNGAATESNISDTVARVRVQLLVSSDRATVTGILVSLETAAGVKVVNESTFSDTWTISGGVRAFIAVGNDEAASPGGSTRTVAADVLIWDGAVSDPA